MDLSTYPNVSIQAIVEGGITALTIDWEVANIDADSKYVKLPAANNVATIGELGTYGKGILAVPLAARYIRANAVITGAGKLRIIANLVGHL